MSKSFLVRGAGVLTVALFAMAAHGCLKVDDSITGLNRSEKGVRECLKDCIDDAKGRRAEERNLHMQIARDCQDDEECVLEEEARHEAAMRSINEEERTCKMGCHNQGGGGAGQ